MNGTQSRSVWTIGSKSLGLFILLFQSLMVAAEPPSASTKVGDQVTNPFTGELETVIGTTSVNANGDPGSEQGVTLESGLVILYSVSVGDEVTDDAGDTFSVTDFVTQNGVNTEAITQRTISVEQDKLDAEGNAVLDDEGNPVRETVSQVITKNIALTSSGSLPNVDPPLAAQVPATSTSGRINEVSRGSAGSNGRDGGGIRICFFGCWTLGVSSTDGGNGSSSSTPRSNIPSSHGSITTTGNSSHGISIKSIGGGGGRGGSGYIAEPGSDGGRAAGGRNFTVTNRTSVNTSGNSAHGFFIESRGGNGGNGGGSAGITGYAGDGGRGGSGGNPTAINQGSIQTSGQSSFGMYSLSQGGVGGSGGSGGGIAASGGAGGSGELGGTATADNRGQIITTGRDSFGVFAQSVGGGGGSGGSSGGLVAVGGSASSAGNGGNVSVRGDSSSVIQTEGQGAYGVLAQSVGGGGGAGGSSGGLVSSSSPGGSGGAGGTVSINIDGSIFTKGNQASGIVAQSVGGGGGSGGGAGGLVALAGGGGGGGKGNSVTVTSAADITTTGNRASGIYAQSVGGGGGSGASAGGLVANAGGGGGASRGGDVSVTNRGNIRTTGNSSFGVFAQSVGGGGGEGGGAGGLVALASSGGGNGSPGGRVVVSSTSSSTKIETEGNDASGIFAQSVGGGGGVGGGAGGLVALSGRGGSGSSGGEVRVTNNSLVKTLGTNSQGIFAQSVGGGGGSGGNTGGLVAIAGSGAGAGNGGKVTVNNTGSIVTGTDNNSSRRDSAGIFAQSIGGGGGSGASAGGLVGLGSGGGGAGHGGSVTVDNSGTVSTWYDDSIGIFAQSVGGGGGSGGGAGGLVAIGGSGSSGGNGGRVTVTSQDDVRTRGARSSGIFAQSIGGGGGSGAGAGGLVGVGSGGGGAGNGGAVSVTSNGSISTRYDDSFGIFAQSVGGGGGSGGGAGGLVGVGGTGSAGGDGGSVTVSVDATSVSASEQIVTGGSRSSAIFAQSIGGGGGNGAGAGGLVGVGGGGGGAGDGASVTVTSVANLYTEGTESRGIFAQSVGGGGGNGGGAGGLVAVAGGGGAASDGGNVTVNSTGDIATGNGVDRAASIEDTVTLKTASGANVTTQVRRSNASGIFAQSIGGGGGSGAGAGGLVGVGSGGGGAGNGGAVSVTSNGSISTRYDDSFGIFAQSVGGGGGSGGGAGGLVAVGGAGSAGGDGGSVTVDVNASASSASDSISTIGERSSAIFAQSVGGGGGNGAGAGGLVGVAGGGGDGSDGASVTVTSVANLYTEGTESRGIFAQSVGGGGGNGAGAGGLVGVAGGGGEASHGGSVTVTSTGNIVTGNNNASRTYEALSYDENLSLTRSTKSRSDASGIFAQSIGGGGGSGAGAGGLVGVGSGGGGAGNGGAVSVTSNGSISTRYDDSFGIFAQSVGGGGGSGGGAGGLVGVGGTGSAGGDGGSVTVSVDATSVSASEQIVTGGSRSSAIFAQSIGGGGGNGAGAGGLVGVGGGGGGAGDGASVTVTSVANLYTEGTESRGIFAQSVGGGGGNGGGAGGLVAVAGGGGAASDGGNVTVNSTGDIATGNGVDRAASIEDTVTLKTASGANVTTQVRRSNASGIFAQSIGGGGGSGAGAGGLVGVGSGGGGAGNGGAVSVTSNGSISTRYDDSFGIFAQSVGGGGGSGGGAGGLVAVGGAGSAGGDGGSVTVDVNASASSVSDSISTIGERSSAIFAQSVGGGGGNGAGAGGLVGVAGGGGDGSDGASVTVTSVANLYTEGTESRGIFAQSVGGGGGNGAGAGGLVGVAGGGGEASHGGSVTVTSTGNIVTGNNNASRTYEALSYDENLSLTRSTKSRSDASGIFAQSIGGGGGSGAGAGGLVGVGSGGGGAGNGGAVSVTSNGSISTRYDDSFGIFAQSVGGGGGSGGGAGGLVGVSGSGSSGGNGGDVSVNAIGQHLIATEGDSSSGIYAQSIGGGGGNASSVGGLVAVAGVSGAGGLGGNVSVTNQNDIKTAGDYSRGIYAQSVGGGGGDGGSAGGMFSFGSDGEDGNDGGDVSVVHSGVIETGSAAAGSGSFSQGIFAQSIGGSGGTGGAAYAGGAFLSLALGGDGGTGGVGGDVSVQLNERDSAVTGDRISTVGNNAVGVFAQSVGGGGGNGGDSIAASVGAFVSSSISLGGSGGAGGDSGKVVFNGSSAVSTSGDHSGAISLQSLGGGGGNGGMSVSASAAAGVGGSLNVSVGLGGSGGDGGDGNTVTAESSGDLSTKGSNATGYLAQSVGGGGGTGGTTVSAGASFAETAAGSVNVGVGGSGGGGGAGSSVEVSHAGSISTQGHDSTAFIAQSIGGGGGVAGTTVAASFGNAGVVGAGVSVGVGGSGGVGGDGATVTASLVGDVSTEGNNSAGFLAQSVGGGGGNTGLTIAAGMGAAGTVGGSVNVGVGGSGGVAGTGGSVSATYNGQLRTSGTNAFGVLAQSVGGGGGNAGGTIGAGAGLGGGVAGAVNVSLGGSGGAGGKAGAVSLTTEGTASTQGDNASAVVAQSIGGGGGNGGFSIAAGLGGGGAGGGAVNIGLGGNGSGGGKGGSVRLVAGSDIETRGDNSSGLLAQSVGGGGGNGGFNVSASAAFGGKGAAGVSVGLGGDGGAGNDSDDVVAVATGVISTHGENATGFTAQSIGGGGGNGGFNVSGSLNGAGVGAGSVNVGLGGSGAGAGNAGSVTASATENIATSGNSSSGFIAQSIGGGGGNGGFNVSGAIAGAGKGSGAVTVGLGGEGGAAGNAGTVQATVEGNVTTRGDDSFGILAQAVGGGGGNGAFNVSASGSVAGVGSGGVSVGLGGDAGVGSDGGDVGLTTSSVLVETRGDRSTAITAQSIGGGGGNGGFNVSGVLAGAGTGAGGVSVGLGGDGGSGGDGKNVAFSHTQRDGATNIVRSFGDDSGGVLIQSVGGGGGNGGFNISATAVGAGTGSGAVAFGLGGSAGGGGDAGSVIAESTSIIATLGDRSSGYIAQSVGGGGGNGGFAITVAGAGAGKGSGVAAVGLGGSGGDGGSAGIVDTRHIGSITTGGDASVGILAQSVGGGGGSGGVNVTANISVAGTGTGGGGLSIGGSGGGGGASADVDSVQAGNLSTQGNNSAGFIAQSLGGGGGAGGLSVVGSVAAAKSGAGALGLGIGGSGGDGGDSGQVNGEISGNVLTMGDSSAGVVAQSLGGGGGIGGVNIRGGVSASHSGAGNIGVGLGGAGGGGGNSSSVVSALVGDVETQGSESIGVLAQSVGGGGGSGGLNVTGGLSLSKAAGGNIGVGLGGSGGLGGNAASVRSTIVGDISTSGKESAGVVAQSIGGGGGSGGINVTGGVAISRQLAGNVGLGIGGSGGNGGNAGAVSSSISGQIVTGSDESAAFLAQSVGGGGGSGGLNVTGGFSVSSETRAGNVGVGIGGMGGTGGHAGSVTATVSAGENGVIATSGANSGGIIAQSLGGGGGSGALNVSGSVAVSGRNGGNLGVGVGGFGGGAGNAADVSVQSQASVTTSGEASHALFAQSVGGGGGAGGVNISGSLSLSLGDQPGDSSGNLNVGIGGFGSGGGDAGSVTVRHRGDLRALNEIQEEDWLAMNLWERDGQGSHGLFAQSLGGGGGEGATNVSGSIAFAMGEESTAYGLNVGIGGFGGSGGRASSVDVSVERENSGLAVTVLAAGKDRSGIAAQSIGGGGGLGGVNVSGSVSSDRAVNVGIGGAGGAGGVADSVSVNADANIAVIGANSNVAAAGILAQSVGGGGGAGGLNVSGSIITAKDAGGLPDVNFGIGGSGGVGNSASTVTVQHSGQIDTSGAYTHGILAQSIGGGGGAGGMNVTGSLNFADSASTGGKTDLTLVAGIGGSGGAGSHADDVSVSQEGIIQTRGDYSRGIFAQSVGGGGGVGGMNFTGVITQKGSPISVTVGGSGGDSGNAGSVNVTRGSLSNDAGQILTLGKGAHGIEASSIGGGGGDAGMSIAGGFSGAGSNEFSQSGIAANFAIGGDGGASDNGDNVSVSNFSNIQTAGEEAFGILAQSIGGGGGNGNFNVNYTFQDLGNDKTRKNKNRGLAFALGGQTGSGGDAGSVSVVQRGNIITTGAGSTGILAQSIGGGGGNAGMNLGGTVVSGGDVAVTIGREGGTGGDGESVAVDFSGDLFTEGAKAYGILAQSLGNGGGNSSVTTVSLTSAETPKKPPGSVGVSVGLPGGIGGVAGDVSVITSGRLTTNGNDSHAVFAQSIGGGGGNAGSASTGGLTTANLGVAIGLGGGKGGKADQVQVDNTAVIKTNGAKAFGVLAQSIGGGGGTGGSARNAGLKGGNRSVNVAIGGAGGEGNVGGDVIVTNRGVVVTAGEGSHAVVAQSIGGGGGLGGNSTIVEGLATDAERGTRRVSVAVGGAGGTGESAGAVTVTNYGSVGTESADAVGIFAQSIGGGGGIGGDTYKASVNNRNKPYEASLRLGGLGGTGGAGNTVTVNNLIDDALENSGMIVTQGDGSHGIVAMSIGGGGGNGGSANSIVAGTPTSTQPAVAMTLNLGGEGGIGGVGGDVNVLNESAITTYGQGAHGILAQSVGGGGGNGGIVTDIDLRRKNHKANYVGTVGGSGGSGNTGGNVTVTNAAGANITVVGDASAGILAQSVGGGGGNAGFELGVSLNPVELIAGNPIAEAGSLAIKQIVGGQGGNGGDGGDVTVVNNGAISVRGDNSFGIFAQSVGGGGGQSSSTVRSVFGALGDGAQELIEMAMGARTSDGVAGKVDVQQEGDIDVIGNNSLAVFSQEVNGGGGNADLFVNLSRSTLPDEVTTPQDQGPLKAIISMGAESISGSPVSTSFDWSMDGDIRASGEGASGATIQSVSGGGGRTATTLATGDTDNRDVNVEMNLGSSDSNAVAGGQVSAARSGQMLVQGDHAYAGTVQSVGGGGGLAKLSFVEPAVNASSSAYSSRNRQPDPAQSINVRNRSQNDIQVTQRLGASGGSFNHGGNIAYSGVGDVVIDGDFSAGLVVQSIGAGGGIALIGDADRVTTSFGGRDGAQGDGGDISFSNMGAVGTTGDLTHGLVVQSIGGGGGLVISEASELDINRSQDNIGNGGDVAISIDSAFSEGTGSHAVIVQSLGGGGGIANDQVIGSAGGEGTSGNISVMVSNNVYTSGANGVGLLAQSSATGDSGNVDLDVGGDVLVYGAGGLGIRGESSSLSGSSANIDIDIIGSVLAAGSHSLGIDHFRSVRREDGQLLTLDIGNDLVASGGSATGARVGLSGAEISSDGDASVTIGGNLLSTGEDAVGLEYLIDAGELEKSMNLSIGGSVQASNTNATGVQLELAATSGQAILLSSSIGGDLLALGDSASAAVLTAAVNDFDVVETSVGGDLVAEGVSARGLIAELTSTNGIESLSTSIAGSAIANGDGSSAFEMNLAAADAAGAISTTVGGDLLAVGDSASAAVLTAAVNDFDVVETSVGGDLVAEGVSARGLIAELTSTNGIESLSTSIAGSAIANGDGSSAFEMNLAAADAAGAISTTVGGDLLAVGDSASAAVLTAAVNDFDVVETSVGGDLVAEGVSARGLIAELTSTNGIESLSTSIAGSAIANGDGSSAFEMNLAAGDAAGAISTTVGGDLLAVGDSASAAVLTAAVNDFDVVETSVGGDLVAEGVSARGLIAELTSTNGIESLSTSIAGSAIANGDGSSAFEMNLAAADAAGAISTTVGGDLLAVGDSASAAALSANSLEGSVGHVAFSVAGNIVSEGSDSVGLSIETAAANDIAEQTISVGGAVGVAGSNAIGVAVKQTAERGLSGSEVLINDVLLVEGNSSQGINIDRSSGAGQGINIVSLQNGLGVYGNNSIGVATHSIGSELTQRLTVEDGVTLMGDDSVGLKITYTSKSDAFTSVRLTGDVFVSGENSMAIEVSDHSIGFDPSLTNHRIKLPVDEKSGVKSLAAMSSSAVESSMREDSLALPDGSSATKAAISDPTFTNHRIKLPVDEKSGVKSLAAMSSPAVESSMREDSLALPDGSSATKAAISDSTLTNHRIKLPVDEKSGVKSLAAMSSPAVESSMREDSLALPDGSSATKAAISDPTLTNHRIKLPVDEKSGVKSLAAMSSPAVESSMREDSLALPDGSSATKAAISDSTLTNHRIKLPVDEKSGVKSLAAMSSPAVESSMREDSLALPDGSSATKAAISDSTLTNHRIKLPVDEKSGVKSLAAMSSPAVESSMREDSLALPDGSSATKAAISDSTLTNHRIKLPVDEKSGIKVLASSLEEFNEEENRSSREVSIEISGSAYVEGDGSRLLNLHAASLGFSAFTSINENESWISADGARVIETSGVASLELVNDGILADVEGLNATPWLGGNGADRLINNGSFVGNFDMGGGINYVFNSPTGFMNAGLFMDLGNIGSTLRNEGTFILGELLVPEQGYLTGNLALGSEGTWYTAVDFTDNELDLITAAGDATLDGVLDITVTNAQLILPGVHQLPFVYALNVEMQDLQLSMLPSLLMDYSFVVDDQSASFQYDLDFRADWLGENYDLVGNHINNIQKAGSTPLLSDTIWTLLFTTSEDAIEEIYSQISPEIYAQQEARIVSTAMSFAANLPDCSKQTSEHLLSVSGSCVWVGSGQDGYEVDLGSTWSNFDYQGDTYALGIEVQLNDNWWLAVAGDRRHGTSVATRVADMSYDKVVQGGSSLIYRLPAGWTASALLSGGNYEFETTRNVNQSNDSWASSVRRGNFHSYGVAISKRFTNSNGVYWEPAIDTGYLKMESFEAVETGDTPYLLDFERQTQGMLWVRPRLNVGAEDYLIGDYRLQARLGLARRFVFNGDGVNFASSMMVAPDEVAPMVGIIDPDEGLGELDFDLAVFSNRGLSLRLGVQHQFGKVRDSYSGRILVGWEF